jgi:hypothetical protein
MPRGFTGAAAHSSRAPVRNSTVPTIGAVPGLDLVTVAVKVTIWTGAFGLTLELTVVVVSALPTVRDRPGDVDAVKLTSPLYTARTRMGPGPNVAVQVAAPVWVPAFQVMG